MQIISIKTHVHPMPPWTACVASPNIDVIDKLMLFWQDKRYVS